MRLLYVFMFSSGGSTKPPLDPPQYSTHDPLSLIQRNFRSFLLQIKFFKLRWFHRLVHVQVKMFTHLNPLCTKQSEVSNCDSGRDFAFENFVVSHENVATEVIMKLIKLHINCCSDGEFERQDSPALKCFTSSTNLSF